MKRTISAIALMILSLTLKGQTIHTYEINPDTTIIIKVNVATNDTTVTYDVSNYFQFEMAGLNRDSFIVKWSTIRGNGNGVKNTGYQNLPMSAITLVDPDSISVANVNSILQSWGITAIRRKTD